MKLVYEESAMLCIIFGETLQASPLLAQLVSSHYSQSAASATTSAGKADSKSRRQDSILALYLLDVLLSNFSSQWSLISVLKDSSLNDGADEVLEYFKTLSLHIRRLEFTLPPSLFLRPSMGLLYHVPSLTLEKNYGSIRGTFFGDLIVISPSWLPPHPIET